MGIIRYLCTMSAFLIIGFFGGLYAYQKIYPIEPAVITKTEIKWQDKVITRDYTRIEIEECKQLLACYDTAKPELDGHFVGPVFRVNAGICEREWSRDFLIGQSGNWKFYIGAAVAGAIIGGYLIYKVR